MQEFEIRVLKKDRTAFMTIEVAHASDHAAIRAAGNLAEGQPFEVWRGLICIYDGFANQTSRCTPLKLGIERGR